MLNRCRERKCFLWVYCLQRRPVLFSSWCPSKELNEIKWPSVPGVGSGRCFYFWNSLSKASVVYKSHTLKSHSWECRRYVSFRSSVPRNALVVDTSFLDWLYQHFVKVNKCSHKIFQFQMWSWIKHLKALDLQFQSVKYLRQLDIYTWYWLHLWFTFLC